MKKIQFAIVTFIALLTMEAGAANSFSLVYMRPVTDGGRYFTVYDSKNLEALQFNIGTSLDYAYKPLTGLSSGTTIDITKYYLAGDLFGALGITDWFEIFVDMPYFAYNRFTNPSTLAPASNDTKIGDLQFGAKFRLLNNDAAPVGIAVVPFMTVPTGSQTNYMGNTGVTGGGYVVVDGKPVHWFDWSVNIGGLGRKYVDSYGLNFGSQFLLSGAVGFNVASWASLIAQLTTQTPFGHFYQARSTTPLDTLFGVQWKAFDEKLKINTSAGFGSPYGAGAPKVRGFASISYAFDPITRHHKETPTAATASAAWEPVLFAFGATRLSSDAKSTLDHISGDLHKKPQHVAVTGYTDSIGKKSYNERLSVKRAWAVETYLKTRGIPKANMTVAGRGPANPVASNATDAGRAKNRRVEVTK